MSDKAVTKGTHHIGLTVPDLAKTSAFFLDTLNYSQVGEVPDYPAVFLEQFRRIRGHLTGIILRHGKERVATRYGASDKTRDAAMAQKNPAFGGANRLFGCVAMLARWSHIALRTAPARKTDLLPSNDPVFSETALADGTTMITLWQATNPETAVPFDRKNGIGLHHVAMNVDNGDALDALHRALSVADGVEIEFAPEPLGTGPAKHMMSTIPGGIRVEFIAAQG
jgi:catechol 2,3-dioxygenase-like lactoylglutathione lyase family enzyme